MTSLKCRQCGFELLPETNFCRQCGTPITADLPEENEPATRLFSDKDLAVTERVMGRPTSPQSPRLEMATAEPPKESRRRGTKLLLIGAVLLVLMLGLVTTIAIVRNHVSSHLVTAESMIYPGAQKAMDIAGEGGRVLQLETSDSLEQVGEWYRETLKPDKVVQLSSTSLILKNEKAAVTIVREGNQTNILIKMTL